MRLGRFVIGVDFRLIELNDEVGRGFCHVWQHMRIASATCVV
jgi:hypothetical protein